MTEVTPQLDYARPGPPRWLRRALILVGVVAVAAVAVRWGPAWKERAAVLLDQRRCIDHRAPPDRVVYGGPVRDTVLRVELKERYLPSCWTRFRAGGAESAVVFLHGRTSPSGNRRIVCVEATPTVLYSDGDRSIGMRWSFSVLEPDGLRGPTIIPVPAGGEPSFSYSADRIYAGQPDPADPAHFTFEYENGGARKTVDGWLLDDNTLKFSIRERSK